MSLYLEVTGSDLIAARRPAGLPSIANFLRLLVGRVSKVVGMMGM